MPRLPVRIAPGDGGDERSRPFLHIDGCATSLHRSWGASLTVSGQVRSLARMTIQIPVRMPTFMCVELTVDGHPELDRAIDLPSGSPHDWIAEAYRLSLGLEPHEVSEHDGVDRCHHDEAYAYPRPAMLGVEEIHGLPHDPAVVIRAIETPPIGTPWLSVTSLSSVVDVSGAQADALSTGWLTGEAPFREDDVNRELLRRHGVVQPFFDDSALWFVDPQLPSPSPIATLASAVTPARRLALLAHIDRTDLLRPAVPDYSDAESVLAPLAGLLDLLGAIGIAQDANSGWLPESASDRLIRSLRWGGTLEEARARGEALVSFARREKLVRRFKGRVVATALARKLCVASPRTLETLAAMITATEGDGWHDLRSTRSRAEEAVALLAVADGTAAHIDDLRAAVTEGARAFDEADARVDLDGSAIPWGVLRGEHADGGAEHIIERMGLLSAIDDYGTITSAMREVARCALLSGFPRERYEN